MQAYISNAVWVSVALINIDVVYGLQYFKRRLNKHVCVFAVDFSTHASFLSFSDNLITFDGVANNARLHLSKRFWTLFKISQISVINSQISGTTKAAYVRTLSIDAQ